MFPQASTAVQVTTVSPNGNAAGALLVNVTEPPSSVAVVVPIEAVDVQVPASETMLAVGATEITGGTKSTIVNVAYVQFDQLPAAS